MTRDILAERQEIMDQIKGLTFPAAFERAARNSPQGKALNWKENGEWRHLTYPEYREVVRAATGAFLSLGLKPGEFVVFQARNIPQHYIADLATVHARGTGVSLYNTLSPEQISYIVNHCEAAYALVEDRNFLESFLKIKEEIPGVQKVILVNGADEFSGDDWIIGWDEFLASGKTYNEQNPSAFDDSWKAVKPEDLLTLIYTSGTTGPPKGVMINHTNVLYVAQSFNRVGERPKGSRVISYLPLAHIAERAGSMYIAPSLEGEIYCCPDPLKLAEYLAEVRPHVFFGVPRVFEKVYAGLQARLSGEEDETKKQFVMQALDIGRQVVQLEQKGEPVPDELRQQYEMVDGMVFSQIRAALGLDETLYTVSGAAPISTEVLEFFHSIGIKIMEVYGQSEDTGPTSLNPVESIKIGTVGPSLPGVEVKLAEDGELLVRAPNVSAGYYKDPELTSETFDDEGWLHSGDICEIDQDGYLKVVDRKKEIIITAGGKNIAPSNLENALKDHPLIGQAAVIGDRRKFVSALIVLDPEVAPGWAKSQGVSGSSVAELAEVPTVVEEVDRWVQEVNKQFSQVEQIKKFTILPAEWTAESEELTPTLKLKRRVINDKYGDAIESMYK